MKSIAVLLCLLFVYNFVGGVIPSHRPTSAPVTYKPTNSNRPTVSPTVAPTAAPIISPYPTPAPSGQPTGVPSMQPSTQPSMQPSRQPTRQPTGQPTAMPTVYLKVPSSRPSRRPSTQPSSQPTGSPSARTTRSPTEYPTPKPTAKPTRAPTDVPTATPTYTVTNAPTPKPTRSPSTKPTSKPSIKPSFRPTVSPTAKPTKPTEQPSSVPSSRPTSRPSTLYPTSVPTKTPHTAQPSRTHKPSSQPTGQPSRQPSGQPTTQPTSTPTLTHRPTKKPTGQPTSLPSSQPSTQPTSRPSSQPSSHPTNPTGQPTGQPSRQPTSQPSRQPTRQPSSQPSRQPTSQPTSSPSHPTPSPTLKPTATPTVQPTNPTGQPSSQPSGWPSTHPTGFPTTYPTKSNYPTGQPSSCPSGQPSAQPTHLIRTDSPTGYYQYANVTGSITYSPSDFQICEDLEITIVFNVLDTILTGDSIRISTPGITSGDCYAPVNGLNIPKAKLQFYNKSEVSGIFVEGNYSLNFVDSYVEFKVVTSVGLLYDTWYTIILDRSNGLKLTNSLNATRWEVSISQCSGVGGRCESWRMVGTLPVSNPANPRMGYAYKSALTFTPAYQHVPVSMKIYFNLAFNLVHGDKLYIYMPGFSNRYHHYNKNITDQILIGTTQNISAVYLSYNTTFSWTGRWFEGDYSDHYQGSYLLLQPRGIETALDNYLDRDFEIDIEAYPNTIVPECGRPENFIGFTYEFTTSTSYFYSNRTRFDSVDPIGPGCSDFNVCSGHGSCDYCNNKCYCDEGFGSPSDRARAVSQDFLPDCSTRACPVGTAFGNMPHVYTDGMHRLLECSGSGVCDRSTGTCQCFAGKDGAACEKLTCPGTPMCNGRGVCLSMRQLAQHATALPLRTTNYDYVSDISNATDAWDDNSNYACVCDSSWSVGLGMNETQQAEYFGAACEFRHCPTGDDPSTSWIDETDCYGLTKIPGGETGSYGNKCHVDCSNKGICDYGTGVCSCFPGFTGHNCAARTVY